MKRTKVLALLSFTWFLLSSCGETSSFSSIGSIDSSSSLISEESSSTYSSISDESSSEISTVIESSSSEISTETSSIDYGVSSVSFINPPESINIGDTYQLHWVVTPTYAKNKNVTFFSSNTDVISISNLGVITALSEGTANITVTSTESNISDEISIEVIIPSPKLLKFTNEETEVFLDETLQLTWEFTPALNNDSQVEFYISSPEVLSVNNDGLVTPLSQESSLVTVSSVNYNISDTITISVLPSIVDYVSSILNQNTEVEKTSLTSGTSTYVTNGEEAATKKTENFQISANNEILIDVDLLTYDDNLNIIDNINYKRYQGYIVGDAYYEITDYFENEELEDEFSNTIERYPIGEEINEEDAFNYSNLYNNGENSIYGINNIVYEELSAVSQYDYFNNRHENSTYYISAISNPNSANIITRVNFSLQFDNENRLMKASIEKGNYSLGADSEDDTLLESTTSTYELVYGERDELEDTSINPSNYYYSDYSFHLSYSNDEDQIVDANEIIKGSYLYCFLDSFYPSSAEQYDQIEFVASSNPSVVIINSPTDRVYCREAGMTTLTVSSQRGIEKTIDILVVD